MSGAIARLGARSTSFVEQLGRITIFAGRVSLAALRRPIRMQRFIDEVFHLGVLSLVIICVCGLAVGAVLGLQGYNTLERFGATDSLGTVVGLSLIRELGPVLTALLTTGRAGSATTAEIGTMVATEQLDGLRMMSIDPIHYVVMPKALAMVFVMPLLSALFIVFGITGGYLIGTYWGVDPGSYVTSLETAVTFRDDIAGSFLKAVIFGVIVGVIATYRGYTSAPTSQGVSSATTTTVVEASVSILIFDYFITAMWGI